MVQNDKILAIEGENFSDLVEIDLEQRNRNVLAQINEDALGLFDWRGKIWLVTNNSMYTFNDRLSKEVDINMGLAMNMYN